MRSDRKRTRMATNPPTVATWLLRRLAPPHRRESLIGDLIEQYERGRSSAWYWRQAIVAIGAGFVEEIRDHPLLLARALLLGWALRRTGMFFSASFAAPGRIVSVGIGNWLLDAGHESLRWWWFTSYAFMVPGWVPWWIVSAGIGWVMA